jgi:hypothetical protein
VIGPDSAAIARGGAGTGGAAADDRTEGYALATRSTGAGLITLAGPTRTACSMRTDLRQMLARPPSPR